MTHKEQAARLRRWNRWRRGEGEYKFEGNPEDYRPIPSPEEPKALGKLLDEIADVLERLDEASDGNEVAR